MNLPVIQHEFHDLSHRDQLGPLLTKLGLVDGGVEVGTLYGTYADILLRTWPGILTCVDPWVNQSKDVYFDGANLTPMDQIYATFLANAGRHERCRHHKAFSVEGAARFENGSLDFVYLDGNHAVNAVRDDIAAWWPKVRIGGIFCGHDYNVRYDHETNSDALTAVAELTEAVNVRLHVNWCTSWYIRKTVEAAGLYQIACGGTGRLAPRS